MTAVAEDTDVTVTERAQPERPDAPPISCGACWTGAGPSPRRRARKLAEDPRFAADGRRGRRAAAARGLRAAARSAPRAGTGFGFPTRYGGGGDLGGSIVAFEMLAMGELSLMVKAGVQFGLFGGAVLHLGTERTTDAYLADIVSRPACSAASR